MGGLKSKFNIWLSCHACTSNSLTLFLTNSANDSTATNFKITGTNASTSAVQCVATTVAGSNTSGKTVANCQLFAVIINGAIGPANLYGCIACATTYISVPAAAGDDDAGACTNQYTNYDPSQSTFGAIGKCLPVDNAGVFYAYVNNTF